MNFSEQKPISQNTEVLSQDIRTNQTNNSEEVEIQGLVPNQCDQNSQKSQFGDQNNSHQELSHESQSQMPSEIHQKGGAVPQVEINAIPVELNESLKQQQIEEQFTDPVQNVLARGKAEKDPKEKELFQKEENPHEPEEKNSQSLEKDCDDYIKDGLEEGNISDCFEQMIQEDENLDIQQNYLYHDPEEEKKRKLKENCKRFLHSKIKHDELDNLKFQSSDDEEKQSNKTDQLLKELREFKKLKPQLIFVNEIEDIMNSVYQYIKSLQTKEKQDILTSILLHFAALFKSLVMISQLASNSSQNNVQIFQLNNQLLESFILIRSLLDDEQLRSQPIFLELDSSIALICNILQNNWQNVHDPMLQRLRILQKNDPQTFQDFVRQHPNIEQTYSQLMEPPQVQPQSQNQSNQPLSQNNPNQPQQNRPQNIYLPQQQQNQPPPIPQAQQLPPQPPQAQEDQHLNQQAYQQSQFFSLSRTENIMKMIYFFILVVFLLQLDSQMKIIDNIIENAEGVQLINDVLMHFTKNESSVFLFLTLLLFCITYWYICRIQWKRCFVTQPNEENPLVLYSFYDMENFFLLFVLIYTDKELMQNQLDIFVWMMVFFVTSCTYQFLYNSEEKMKKVISSISLDYSKEMILCDNFMLYVRKLFVMHCVINGVLLFLLCELPLNMMILMFIGSFICLLQLIKTLAVYKGIRKNMNFYIDNNTDEIVEPSFNTEIIFEILICSLKIFKNFQVISFIFLNYHFTLISYLELVFMGMGNYQFYKQITYLSTMFRRFQYLRRNLEQIFPKKYFEKEQMEQCSICHDDLIQARSLKECKHSFHIKCLFQWLRGSYTPKCPICRSEIKNIDLQILQTTNFNAQQQPQQPPNAQQQQQQQMDINQQPSLFIRFLRFAFGLFGVDLQMMSYTNQNFIIQQDDQNQQLNEFLERQGFQINNQLNQQNQQILQNQQNQFNPQNLQNQPHLQGQHRQQNQHNPQNNQPNPQQNQLNQQSLPNHLFQQTEQNQLVSQLNIQHQQIQQNSLGQSNSQSQHLENQNNISPDYYLQQTQQRREIQNEEQFPNFVQQDNQL